MTSCTGRRCLRALSLAALAAAFMFYSPHSLRGAEPAAVKRNAPDVLTLKTSRIVIFKDGYGLVMKDATATADAEGHVLTRDVPDSAVLGTVWALSDKDKLIAMSSQWDNQHEVRKQVTPCLTVRELLRANLNHRVSLELDDKRSITGTAAEILEAPEKMDAATLQPFPAFGGAASLFVMESDGAIDPFAIPGRDPNLPADARLVREAVPRGGDFVVISNESDREVLPISKIHSISGKDLITSMTRQQDVYSRSKRLVFDFGKSAAGKPVSLHFFYFTPGFRWIPTYRITGDLKDSADIALQGEIINDLEDISAANVDLVVGVPNFRFKDAVSPLVLESVLRHATASVSGLLNITNGQMLSNNSYNGGNTIYASREDRAPDPGLPAALAAGAGTEQDLFIYPLENFSLKKGGRATAALWQNSAPVRNVYTYDIKGRRNPNSGGIAYGGAPSSPNRLSVNDIWHQLELTNKSTVPWTTGAALTMKGALPLGQDILAYTSIGSKTLLPLTIAVDLRGSSEEEEISRKPNAAQFEGNQFALIKKKGVITLTNSRKENSDMCVSLAIGGKVDSASDNGKIKLNDFRAEDWDQANYMHVNNHSDVAWEFTLKPGETKKVEYTVIFYSR